MKPKTNSSLSPLLFFHTYKKFSIFLSVVLTIAFINLFVGCSYYTVKDVTTTPETIAKQLEAFNKAYKYVIIHSGMSVWHLNNVVINEEAQSLSGIVLTLGENHQVSNRNKRVHKYSKSKQNPLNEVHLNLTTDMTPRIGSEITIPFSDINSVSVNDRNTGRSVGNAVLGTVGVLATLLIIVALTKSSCPFVYVNNGEEFVFTGELYPGVITANQQRDDYLTLPYFQSDNNEYQIKITNELKEIQHTDFVQLISADHPENTEVLLDKNGNAHTFSSIVHPNKVSMDNVIWNQKPALSKDNISYLFDTEIKNSNSARNIVLEFDKPTQSTKAKLYVTAKNSMWLDYVFGKFNEQFGSYYAQFQKDQQSITKEESAQWINEQHIPLSVYLKTLKGWKLIDRINTVGPMANRDIVIPIDVSDVSGAELQIKLETGFMFWEVDYVGIDYSENVPLELNSIEPYQAIDDANVDVTKLLVEADGNYLVQPNVGDEVLVTFKTEELPAKLKRTVFLKNRGYYNYIRDYSGKPDFAKLKLFKDPGAFTEFSKLEYEAFMDYSDQFDIAMKND